MAGGKDEIDLTELRRLQWGLPTKGSADDLDETQIVQLRMRADRESADVAKALGEARLCQGEARGSALDAVLATAAGLDIELHMLEEPHRTWLLEAWLERGRHLDRKHARATILGLLRAGFPECEGRWDVLLRAIQEGAADISGFILPDDEPDAFPTRVVDGLVGLLERGSPQSRLLAANALATGRYPRALPALRRALAVPELDLRLDTLRAIEACGRRELDPGTLIELIDEAFEHRPTWHGVFESEPDGWTDYEKLLFAFARELRPKELAAVVRRHVPDLRHVVYEWEQWGVCLLALVDPAACLKHLDFLERISHKKPETYLLLLLDALPEAVAKPHLERLADAPAPAVALAAREAWFSRFGAPCPVPRTAGPLEALLETGSEGLATRLQLLDGPVEGQRALVKALLAEAPSKQALVLLLRWLSGGDLHDRGPGLPEHGAAWVKTLGDRFGRAALVKAIVLLVKESPHGDRQVVWLAICAELGFVTRSLEASVRAAALARHSWLSASSVVTVLTELGPGVDGWRTLLEIACHERPADTLDDGPDCELPAASNAREVLAGLGPHRALDDALIDALRGWRGLAQWAIAGLSDLARRRRLRRHLPVLQEIVEGYESGGALLSLRLVGLQLRETGTLDDATLRAWLREPSHPRFGVAACVSLLDPPVRGAKALLEAAARDPDVREGYAAAEASLALILAGPRRGRDVPEVILRLPHRTQLWLLEQGRYRFPSPEVVALPLVAYADPDTADRAWHLISGDREEEAICLAALRRIASPERVALVESNFGAWAEEQYWREVAFDNVTQLAIDEDAPGAPAKGQDVPDDD